MLPQMKKGLKKNFIDIFVVSSQCSQDLTWGVSRVLTDAVSMGRSHGTLEFTDSRKMEGNKEG